MTVDPVERKGKKEERRGRGTKKQKGMRTYRYSL